MAVLKKKLGRLSMRFSKRWQTAHLSINADALARKTASL